MTAVIRHRGHRVKEYNELFYRESGKESSFVAKPKKRVRFKGDWGIIFLEILILKQLKSKYKELFYLQNVGFSLKIIY